MTTEKCTVKGFEKVSITFPDKWLMAHRDLFFQGMGAAPSGASPGTSELYGCIALCEKIEGIEVDDLGSLELHYAPVFDWLRKVVYESFTAAMQPPKN